MSVERLCSGLLLGAWAWTCAASTGLDLDNPLNVQVPTLKEGAAPQGMIQAPLGDCRPDQPMPAEQALDLAQALDWSLCHQPQIRLAWQAIQQQLAQLGQAKAARWPTVQYSITRQASDVRYPEDSAAKSSTRGNSQFAGLSWRLFDGGARQSGVEAATQQLASAVWSHEAQIQKTLLQVIQAFFDAQSAQAMAMARQDMLDHAQLTLSSTRRKHDRGAASVTETLQAELALQKAQLALQRAQADQQKAMIGLAAAMGHPLSSPLQIQPHEDRGHDASAELPPLQAWLRDLADQHPGVLAAQARVQSAEGKLRVAKAELSPTVEAFANAYRNALPNQPLQPTRSKTYAYGVTLSIPLFDGFSSIYKIREAQALLDQERLHLEDMRLQTEQEVARAHAEALSARANLRASWAMLEAARLGLGSIRQRFDRQASDLSELVAAQSVYAEALQERLRCVAEWASARWRLQASVGSLAWADVAAVPAQAPAGPSPQPD